MVHQGTELKRKISINPHPKKSDMTHYRDLVNQNEWLRQNMFDSLGNYLYCCECIRLAFGISKDRISRQRNIKRLQSQQPIVEMAKSDIEKQGLGAFILMPPHLDISFNKWWRSEDPSTMIQVRVPHERHRNAGKVSNSAKTTVHQNFIEFVDINTQPNGRSADSSGPTSYFLPKFSTIQAPKPSAKSGEPQKSPIIVQQNGKRLLCLRRSHH